MTPRQRMKIRSATRRRHLDPSEKEGELNIVPFLDIVVNLMLFMLATSTATLALAEMNTTTPSTCTGCDGRASVGLSVTLADRGIIVASNAGAFAAGCDGLSGSSAGTLTVPRTNDGYDFESLASCLTRVRARYPEEQAMILSADPTVPYDAVISAMDAIRPSFDETHISAGVH